MVNVVASVASTKASINSTYMTSENITVEILDRYKWVEGISKWERKLKNQENPQHVGPSK